MDMFKLKSFIGSFLVKGSQGFPVGAHHGEHGRDNGVRLDRNLRLGSHGFPHDAHDEQHTEKVNGGNDDFHKDGGIDIDNLGEHMLDGHDHTLEEVAKRTHGTMHHVNFELMVMIKGGKKDPTSTKAQWTCME